MVSLGHHIHEYPSSAVNARPVKAVIHHVDCILGGAASDSAEFNPTKVKVESVWCPLMSSTQLCLKAICFGTPVMRDALAVARSCFIMSFLVAVTDANSSLFGYSVLHNSMMEWKRPLET